MKNLSYGSLIAFLTILFSCSSGTFSNDSVDSARDINDSILEEKSPALGMDFATADFVVNAASAGMLEVAMANVARRKAFSVRVRTFGAIIARDDARANEELREAARSQGIVLPLGLSADSKKTIDKICKQKGKEFDKAFMEMMTKNNKEHVAEFKKASASCKNRIIKNYAVQSLRMQQEHLDSARAISIPSR